MTLVQTSFAPGDSIPKRGGFAIGVSCAQSLGYSEHVGRITSFGGTSYNAEMSIGMANLVGSQSLATVVSRAIGGFFSDAEQGLKEFHGEFVSTPLNNIEGAGNITLTCPASTSLSSSQNELVCGINCETAIGYFSLRDSIGNQSVTGLGFQPDFIMFVGPIYRSFDNSAHRFGLGMVDKNGNEWAVAEAGAFITNHTQVVINNSRARAFFADRCMHAISTDTIPAVNPEQSASIVSFDPDGFTIDVFATGVDPFDGTTLSNVLYLAVKLTDPADGIAVGTAVQGDTAITGVGFQPEAVFFASTQENQGSSPTAGSGLCLGMSDVTNNNVCQRVGEILEKPKNYFDNASCIYFGNVSETVLARATTTSLDPDGFTLAWSTDDGNASRFGWAAFKVGGGSPCFSPSFTSKHFSVA